MRLIVHTSYMTFLFGGVVNMSDGESINISETNSVKFDVYILMMHSTFVVASKQMTLYKLQILRQNRQHPHPDGMSHITPDSLREDIKADLV